MRCRACGRARFTSCAELCWTPPTTASSATIVAIPSAVPSAVRNVRPGLPRRVIHVWLRVLMLIVLS